MTRLTRAGSLGAIVDQLGALKAQIADLTTKEKDLKAILIDAGAFEFEGELFRATVSIQERTVRDDAYKARVEELIEEGISRQFAAAHTSTSETPVVKVVARTRKTSPAKETV